VEDEEVEERAKPLVEQATSPSASIGERESALEELLNLTRAHANQVRLIKIPGVVEVLINAARNGENNDIKFSGLGGLSNLAQARENAVHMFETPGVVDIFVDAAKNGETSKLRRFGVVGLSNLAGTSETLVPLFKTNVVLEVLMDAAKNGETDEIKEVGLSGLQNLSIAPENRVPLFETPGVVDVFLNAAKNGPNNEVKWIGVGGLMHLSIAPKSREELKRNQAVLSVLAARSKSKHDRTRFVAIIALAILTGSDENSTYLGADASTLETITIRLENAVNGESIGWTIAEPLLALRYLTTVDENRKKLGSSWLPNLVKAIAMGLETNEHSVVENALLCLLQYTFDEEILEGLQDDDEVLATAKGVIAEKADLAEWGGAVNTANSLIFKLEGRDKLERSEVSVDKTHVMISYSWGAPPHHENKKLAAFVESYLKERGFNVWRDENEMRSNILEAMAEAVTRASAVVVLVTKAYKESANCKLELTFALKHNKKIIPLLAEPGYGHFTIDGWLGLAFKDLFYYDISTPQIRKAALATMVKREMNSSPSAALMTPTLPAATANTSPSSAVAIPDGEEEVRRWAKNVGLDSNVEDRLIREGFVNRAALESLLECRAAELKELLGLRLGASATLLKKALKDLLLPEG